MADIIQTKKLSEMESIHADKLHLGDRIPVIITGEDGKLKNANIPKESFIRAKVTHDVILYIDPINGNDGNEGELANNAVATWTRVLDICYSRYNFNQFNLTISHQNLQDGLYVLDYGQLVNVGAIFTSGFSGGVKFQRINTVADYAYLPVFELGIVSDNKVLELSNSRIINTMSLISDVSLTLNFPDTDDSDSYTYELHITCDGTERLITWITNVAITYLDAQEIKLIPNKTTIILIRIQGKSLLLINNGGVY